MSSRSLHIAALCCALALCGCEKKTEEQPTAQPVKVVRSSPAVPAGMAQLGEKGTLFIDTTPLTVAQYVEYLRGTGQPVPAKWAGLEPGSPVTAKAVTGLDKREAERCAAWQMKRVPTLKEWQDAVRVVGARPYPWLEDGQPVPQGAPILLIRDWSPRTQEELDARAARGALAQTILEESREEFDKLRADLAAEVKLRQERQEARWEAFKPAFFNLLDKRQELAAAAATREGRELALQVITRLADEKGKLAIALKAEDLPAGEQDTAVQQYARTVGELRTKVEGIRNELTTSSADLQRQVVELTRTLERAGAPEKNATLVAAAQLLARFEAPPEGTVDVMAANEALSKMTGALQAAPEALGGALSAQDLRTQAAGLDEQLAEMAAAKPTTEDVQAEKDRLARIGEAVDREIVQEGILLAELNGLIGLRATKASLEARLQALKEVLAQR
jgi:hypothetical protein